MILDDIKTKLEAVDANVFYGLADDASALPAWNYIVYRRLRKRRIPMKGGFSDYYTVAVIRENFIPEGLIEQIIAAMEEVPGLNATTDDIQYDYVRKPSTDAVVEVATITFSKPKKA